ncbi:MAG: polysaccharide deacetylase family protein [Phycisphaerae bacterium]|nr:polysaccharide deacetylase family protein [Gemmatimonadaceae bacterium]
MPSDGRSSRLGPIGLHATVALAAFCGGLAANGALRPAFAIVALLPMFAAIAIGVVFPVSGVFGRPVHRGVSGRREVALTFDDGPDPRWTPAVLDLLDARGQRATFFVIGMKAERNAALLRDIAERGHEIANHSWSHSNFTPFMSPRTMADELLRTNAVIEHATGRRPRWFRPPVGLLSPRVVAGAARAEMELVCWSATARDGVEHTTIDEGFDRLAPALVPGAILVMHDARISGDGEPAALQILRRLLDRMDMAGLRSVTVSELCG